MAMGFDLDLSISVTMDSGGNMTMIPIFHVTLEMQGSGNPMDPADGGIQGLPLKTRVVTKAAREFKNVGLQKQTRRSVCR